MSTIGDIEKTTLEPTLKGTVDESMDDYYGTVLIMIGGIVGSIALCCICCCCCACIDIYFEDKRKQKKGRPVSPPSATDVLPQKAPVKKQKTPVKQQKAPVKQQKAPVKPVATTTSVVVDDK